MNRLLALACLLPLALHAHTLDPKDKDALRQHILDEFLQSKAAPKAMKLKPKDTAPPTMLQKPAQVAAMSGFDLSSLLGISSFTPPAGNGLLMQASFAPFKPKVRFNWDPTTFFVESDNMPNGMPNRMVGITTWQQQIPLPTAYFASVTNNENDPLSRGFGQPNYWRVPLVPVPAASPIPIYNPPAAPTHFLRGAVALASNGVAIFNPANNTGQVSYAIGELDYYGGHCGLADDYHYHIIPTHLNSRFGGPLGDDKPVAWALDGYPIYGFLEPDGTARQALDSDGGHDIGNGWGYHYHAMGTTTTDATHPYGTPQSPYMMKNFHGTVIEYPLTNPTQVDGQPEVSSLRADNSGGYNAKAVAGARIVALLNPVALTTDGSGHYIENTAPGAVASPDAYIMRVNFSGTVMDECWTINRKVNPRTLTVTWRMPTTIVASVTNSTQFKLSAPATGTGTGITLTAGPNTLTNCSLTAGSTTVTCDSTTGLNQGQVVTGANVAARPTTTTTYTPTAGSANGARLTAYPMGAWSEAAVPDTSQVVNTTATFGEDSDYTINAQSFTDNGNGTISDNVTGLMWQKVDAGEMTWENAVNNASAQTTGGYSDWRLPNPHELFSIMNHENQNPAAINTTFFPNNPSGTAEYWWTRDVFGSSTTNVWCVNAGGGAGPKPKAETLSAGGSFRYHARYVRGAQNNMTHNYVNNGDGTITDTDTSLMWTQLPSSAMPWDSALTYAEGLTTGGYSDWRVPNIKELQTITDYALATTSGGSATNLKPAINRTMFAKTLASVATTVGSATVTCPDTTGMVAGMVLVDPYSVAGTYISNTTAPTVASVVNSTTFTMSANAASTGTGLIFRALPVATAYWSSTSNKGTSTEAWLLELGVNNSVPVAEGPPRGSQGIISYQAKTASFPVFAVRTAVLTTTIAVSQGATSLTDGVSTVAYGNVNVGSSLSKTFTINNTGSSVLNISGVTIDGTNSANFSVTSSPASSIPASGSTTFTVLFNALTAGSKVAALHIASDDAGNPSFDINLTGSGFVPPPTISNITVNPISPSGSDPAVVTATVTPGFGSSINAVQLSYNTGGTTTSTVLNETMTSTATVTGGWDGTGAVVPWTVTTNNGAGNIQQTTGSNHTAVGQGGTCGVQFNKGSTTASNYITTTNALNIGTATSAALDFWVSVTNINASGIGWNMQLATDAAGTNWNTVLSEVNVANHGFINFHYDLAAGERVSTLRLRFNFLGNGVGGGTGPKVLLDDITLSATTGVAPTTITMYDDGLHGDGAANDGIWGATIPAQANGTNVNFTIAATGSGGSGTTTSSTTSYTVAPAPTITTASPLPNGNTTTAYNQTLAATGGSGTGYTWSVFSGALPSGITLSSGGVLSGTATSGGTFNFVAKVTDSLSRSGTKAFALTITANTPPNVVIIVTDDQGWGDVGYHTPAGQVPIQTPNMDSFGTTLSGSIRLERFYATTVCSVTRSTLMTGRNAIRHGTNNERGLDLSEHLLPQTFKAAGYQTFMCGKWHLGGSDKNIYHFNVNGSPVRVIKEGLQYAPFNRGWDSHYGQYSGAIDYFTHNSAEAESLDVPDWWLNGVQQDGPSEHTDSRGYGGWSPTLLADKAIAHIQNRNPSQPMLLHLAFNSIHGPVSAPASLITKYQNFGVTNANRRLISAAVDGMDQEIGRVLAALDTAGIANNTLVIWFGDNGGDETKGSLNDPLRGTKGDSYEGGMREPAGIRWPGVLPTGVISNQYMWVGDVFPTICAATGVTPQNTKPLDGVNLWPALLAASNSTTVSRGSPLVTVTAAPIAIYQFTDPVNGGVKDFKVIRSKVGTTTVTELYNLTDDPQETTDLIANSAYASIVTTLTNAITAISVENMKPYVGPPLITNSVAQGGTITLYAPFTSYPGAAPAVQWRKGGSNIAGGVVTQIDDGATPTPALVKGTYAATLTLTNVSPTDAGTYDVIVSNNVGSTTSDAGTLSVTAGGPTIDNVSTGPTAPTYLDATYVLATVTPTSGSPVSQVQLIYDNGVPQTTSLFTETMRSAAATPWTGDGCNNAWLPTPASTTDIAQTTNANHGAGNPCGLDFKRGTTTMGDRSVTTTNAINAAGSAGYVEFWVATSNLTAGLGWTFQTSTDGITWNTRLSEVDGSSHGYTSAYHYDLAPSELVSTLKLRFQFAGNGLGGASASKVQIDDIIVVTTAPAPPVTLAMFDDGNHGDGAANDGVWGALIPAQAGGRTVSFHVTATNNNGTTTMSPTSSNYIYTVNNLLTDATILGSEFLTLPKTDGVTLNLIASADQQVYVEYGTQPGKYTLATTPTVFSIDNAKPEFKNPIRIPITRLQQDTEYYYRVRHRNVGAPFYNARGERSFHTARPRGTTFSFTVTADPHIDVNTDMQLFWRAMANISLDQPDIHMDVGDIFMTDKLADGLLGVPPKWGGGVTINQTTINNRAIIFRNAFERACHSIPFFFGLGNHEAEYGYLFTAAADKQNNIPAWDLKARKAFYPAPTPDGFFNGNPTPKDYTGGTLGLLEDYYAFEWGEALFIMLDPFWNTMTNPNSSNDAWNWSLGKVQYDWLRDMLKNSSAKYKFVFMHHIVGGSTQAIINGVPTPQFAARGGIEVSDKYEWGGKNADGSAGFATKRPGWDMPIHDLLVLNKVNVVFHGHDHLYGYQTKDGIVYLECPQPGTPNYSSLGSAADGQYVDLGANSTSYLLPNSGHIRVTVGPNNCVADYVRSYRTSTDPMPPDATSVFNDETASRHNRDISHSFVLAPKTYASIEVANVGPGQVGLRWNAVANKTYQIQWSTDLVNWTTIDTLTFTNTNTNATYTDSLPARINGQRAFYRVSYNP